MGGRIGHGPVAAVGIVVSMFIVAGGGEELVGVDSDEGGGVDSGVGQLVPPPGGDVVGTMASPSEV